MADEVVIRALRAEDEERLVEIALAAWTPIYAHSREVLGEEMFLCLHPDWHASKGGQIRQACTHPERVLVAEVGGVIAGFVTFALAAPGVGEINNNAVDPAFQGQGIAGRLYEAAFAWMRAAGATMATVGTGGDPAHAPARRAYEKAGFDRNLPSVRYYRKL